MDMGLWPMRWLLGRPPANSKQLLRAHLLLQFAFDCRNELVSLAVNLVLSIEQGTPFQRTLTLERLDLLLERLLQRVRDDIGGLIDVAKAMGRAFRGCRTDSAW